MGLHLFIGVFALASELKKGNVDSIPPGDAKKSNGNLILKSMLKYYF